MCFELADQRGPQRGAAGAGGGGWPAKGGPDERAAAGMAMAGVGPGDVMSEYHQARELSTMVSALAHVVAGEPWGGDEAPAPRGGGGAPEQQAMHGGYAREVGSYHGVPSPEFAGNQLKPCRHVCFPAQASARARFCCCFAAYRQASILHAFGLPPAISMLAFAMVFVVFLLETWQLAYAIYFKVVEMSHTPSVP